ncbi:hypothetical protein O6H91_Y302500 [Diphasiastrum complanatum]|nr:hypothetical protein O6H91_Y302500 [Diphasiastrum complanatum]
MLYEMSSASLEWVGDGRLFVRSHFSLSLRHVEAALPGYADGLGQSGNKDALLPTNLNKNNCAIGSRECHSESKKSQGSTSQMLGHCNSYSLCLKWQGHTKIERQGHTKIEPQ